MAAIARWPSGPQAGREWGRKKRRMRTREGEWEEYEEFKECEEFEEFKEAVSR